MPSVWRSMNHAVPLAYWASVITWEGKQRMNGKPWESEVRHNETMGDVCCRGESKS